MGVSRAITDIHSSPSVVLLLTPGALFHSCPPCTSSLRLVVLLLVHAGKGNWEGQGPTRGSPIARGTWPISSPVLVYLPSCSSQTHLQRTVGHESSQPWEIFVPAKQLIQRQTSPLTLLLSLSWVSSYCVLKCGSEGFPGLQRGGSPWATGEYWAMNPKGRHRPGL